MGFELLQPWKRDNGRHFYAKRWYRGRFFRTAGVVLACCSLFPIALSAVKMGVLKMAQTPEFWIGALMALIPIPLFTWIHRKHRARTCSAIDASFRLCPACGYDLSHTATQVNPDKVTCPECANTYSYAELTEIWQSVTDPAQRRKSS